MTQPEPACAADLPTDSVVAAFVDIDPETENPIYAPTGRSVIFHHSPTEDVGIYLAAHPWVTADLPMRRRVSNDEVQHAINCGAQVLRVGDGSAPVAVEHAESKATDARSG